MFAEVWHCACYVCSLAHDTFTCLQVMSLHSYAQTRDNLKYKKCSKLLSSPCDICISHANGPNFAATIYLEFYNFTFRTSVIQNRPTLVVQVQPHIILNLQKAYYSTWMLEVAWFPSHHFLSYLMMMPRHIKFYEIYSTFNCWFTAWYY